MILESRIRPVRSLGYQRQQWPAASHYVVRVGRREARVIVETGETVPFVGLVAMLAAGLIIFPR